MKNSMEGRIDKLTFTSLTTSQTHASCSEDHEQDLHDDDQYPAESMDFRDDCGDWIDWDYDEPQQSCDDELPEENCFDWRSSIYDRPVCGRFGRLYWLKIQLRIALLRVCDLIKTIKGDAEGMSSLPDDFPF
jgi:hypothetical protein